MLPLNALLTLELLEDLATRSNFRYGKEIAKKGKFSIEKENTYNLITKVEFGGGERRTVELMSTSKGFRWKCTCTSRKDMFCNHCVGVGLARIEGKV